MTGGVKIKDGFLVVKKFGVTEMSIERNIPQKLEVWVFQK